MKYQLITVQGRGAQHVATLLSEKVTAHLAAGWVLHGAPFEITGSSEFMLAQAITLSGLGYTD